jgi:RNase P/RNase MRP subunit p29
MIVIRSATFDKIIKIPKNEILKYCITTKQKMFVLPGKRLLGRPEEVKGKIR